MNYLYLLLFFITTLSFANKVPKEEISTYLEAIKEKKDEELLIASPQFSECSEKLEEFRGKTDDETNQKLHDCVEDKILGDGTDQDADKKMLEVSKKLSLNSYNKHAAKSSTSIREYLQKRLKKAIYGPESLENKKRKLKEQNLVNHDVFYQLYAEQIGKNTLLEVSKYCLETFGYGDPFDGNLIHMKSTGTKDQKGNDIAWPAYVSVIKKNSSVAGAKNFDDQYVLKDELETGPDQYLLSSSTKIKHQKAWSSLSLWRNHDQIKEFEVCTFENKEQCDKHFKDANGKKIRDYRPLKIVELLKEAEFKFSTDQDKSLIKNRYLFCASTVIKNMCELYKCNNTYDSNSPDEEKKYCAGLFGITVSDTSADASISLKSGNQKGQVACNLMQRLQEYRIVLKGIKDIQEDNKTNKVRGGVAYNTVFKDLYNGAGKGMKSIDKLTSIGSKELSENVSEISNAKENAKNLRKECFSEDKSSGLWTLKSDAASNKKCKVLLAKLDQSKFDTIEIDTEAKTAMRMKEISNLSGDDLNEFLDKHGLKEYKDRLGKIADDPAKVEQIKNLVAQDFKAKRMALLDGLRAKYAKERKIKVGAEDKQDLTDNDQLKTDTALKNLADMEQHKKRVATLFEYSNIVSSYLTVRDKDEKVIGSNSTGRQLEVKTSDNESIKKYFSDDNSEESNSGGGNIDYLQALDQIIN
ncbi:MAG: hypothetical protein HON90_00905 [Halobacteriovoraceae bacterium]|jgi:hypothetical protein|nr:hypothetical protein [Halobacteriovoraceae bacterium]